MKPYKNKLDQFFKHTTKPELFNICMLLSYEISQSENQADSQEQKMQKAFELLFSARATIRKRKDTNK